MTNFLELIIAWILIIIARFGYLGIFVMMMLESAAIPIPSEIVLPFSGFLAGNGTLSLSLVVLVATVANLIGASLLYFVGFYAGRAVLEHYGRYIFIHQDDITKLDRWFLKNQSWTTFVSRLMPGVRTFNSLVIGTMEGVRFYKFLSYTFLGSLVWNFALAYAGFWAGSNWNFLHPYFQKIEILIGIAVICGIIFFVYHHIKKIRN